MEASVNEASSVIAVVVVVVVVSLILVDKAASLTPLRQRVGKLRPGVHRRLAGPYDRLVEGREVTLTDVPSSNSCSHFRVISTRS